MSLLGLDLQCKVAEELAVEMPEPGRKLELAVGFRTENGAGREFRCEMESVVHGGPEMVNSRIALAHIRGEKQRGTAKVMAGGGDEWRVAARAEVFVSLAQNAMVSVKELCGLPPIASLKQCILTLSSRLVSSDNAPSVALCMKDTFPYLEPLGTVPDVQKKVLAAYDLVST